VPAGGPLQRRVLARLAMEAGRPVTLDDLEEVAWGEAPPPASRHIIATHVFRLRRLGLEIATGQRGYVLETATDAGAFEHLTAEAEAAAERKDFDAAVAASRAALALWRGDPLGELTDLPEAAALRGRLEDRAEGLREEVLGLELETHPAAGLISTARELVDRQPYRERRWELLMLALYRAGRQADALDAFAECRRRLVDDLGIDPGAGLRRMQQAILAQDPALEPPGAVESGPGPAGAAGAAPAGVAPTIATARIPGVSTRLIGRAVERQELSDVWSRSRLATLLGPPGAGKTRLALEAVHADAGPVWYVSLDQVPASHSVAGAILDVVAPSSRAAEALTGVVGALGRTSGLLVLDGCEGRVREATPTVERILAACPGMRILATSRERLGVVDEAVLPVAPLVAADAIALLVDRARLADPRFALAPGEEALADRLCALVDRLPLGLELVALHLRLLRLGEVVERVEADLGRWAGSPAPGRAGLWAALDTSIRRLVPAERRALVALAVMVADADLELIAEVAGLSGDEDAFDLIAGLVDASLVQVRSADGPTRYGLLRTLAERTVGSAAPADVSAARGRYAEAVVTRAEGLAGHLGGAERSETLRRLSREMPHVRAVLGAATDDARRDEGTALRALRLSVSLADYWLGRHPAEGLESIGRLVEATAPGGALLAEALLAQGHLAYWVTDFARGAQLVDRARAIFAGLGDPLGEGRALRRRGAIAAATDDMPAARAALEASLERLEAAGDDREIGTTLLHLGSLLADEGISRDATPLLERALGIALASADPLAKGHVLGALTLAHWKGGELEAAMATGNEALLIFHELGHRPTEGTVAYRLAAVARGLGRPKAARRYAELAIEAGEQSTTRTTVALGHINLARLDLDAAEAAPAAAHLSAALELVDAGADRWVAVELLETAARLLALTGRTGASILLATSAGIRREIRQPGAPTEAGDLEWTRTRARDLDATEAALDPTRAAQPTPTDARTAMSLAARQLGEVAGPSRTPQALRRLDA
jgi:predicted ATPase/DNA-binding SARP family transcriptional activator